jgi:hypothetical protein
VPDALRERILAAVRTTDAGETANDVHRAAYNVQRTGPSADPLPVAHGTLHDQLKDAGERLLAEAKSAAPSRDTAITLLAADALMTFACEAMAEEAPERLGSLR